jgi:hypothetical protein
MRFSAKTLCLASLIFSLELGVSVPFVWYGEIFFVMFLGALSVLVGLKKTILIV